LAQLSGLILCGRAGKHTDGLAIELLTSTESKTGCKEWGTDGWESYQRVLPDEVEHYISKILTQRLERINSILRSKLDVGIDDRTNLAKYGSRRKSLLRLVISYFNWIWRHSCLGTTATSASRAN